MSPSLRSAACAAALATLVASLTLLSAAVARPQAHAKLSPARASSFRDTEVPTDRFIVRFKEDTAERRNPVARQHLLDAIGAKAGVRVGHGRGLVNGADLLHTERRLGPAAAKRVLIALQRDPRVEYAAFDRVHRPMFIPNDPLFAQQT